MKHVFVINPVAGKEDAARLMAPQIHEAAQRCGIEVETRITEAPRHGVSITQEYGRAGDETRLYAVGGDGTLNEVFTGAYPFPNLEVACVPCGSGNDFVKSFGEAEDFSNLDDQMQGTAVPIDLIEVDGGVCAAITSTGLDAEVAYNIPKYRRIPLLGGAMAYNISIVEKLLHPLGKNLVIDIDGQRFEGRYLIATVCNGKAYGGGYMAAPMACLDDGELEVILVKKLSRLLIAGVIGSYKKGQHVIDGEVIPKFKDIMYYCRAKEVTITPAGDEPFILNVDGECGPAKRLYAKVMPLAARFVLPKPLYVEWEAKKQ